MRTSIIIAGAPSSTAARGPAGKGFKDTLGITAHDLELLVKEPMRLEMAAKSDLAKTTDTSEPGPSGSE